MNKLEKQSYKSLYESYKELYNEYERIKSKNEFLLDALRKYPDIVASRKSFLTKVKANKKYIIAQSIKDNDVMLIRILFSLYKKIKK